jgi:hypothetical protein
MVPVLVYGAASSLTGLPVPGGSPIIFLAGVLVSKMGTAFAFVALFYMARNAFADRWLQYAFVWWLMFAFGEVGQAIGPDYSWAEALAGLISEAIYFPLSAYLASWLFGNQIPLQKTAR